MSYAKAPSAIRGDQGLLSSSRFSRTYCGHCNGEELHISGVCVQCKRGGIPMTAIKMEFIGRGRRK